MKIAIFISKFYPEFSGVSRRIIRLYKEIYKKKKIYVDVYSGGENIKFRKNYKYKFFNIRKLNDTLKIKVKIIKIFYEIISFIEIFKILKKKKYNFIHIVGSNNVTASAINASCLLEIPKIIELVTKRSSPYQQIPIIKFFYKPTFLYNSLIVSINKDILNNFYKKNIKNKIWIRDNPIDKKFIYPNKYKFNRKKYGFSKNDIIICQVAQFYESKNQIFLIDVMRLIPKKFKLILAGPLLNTTNNSNKDTKYFKKIKEKIKLYNLKDRVTLIPRLVNTAEILSISNLSLMPNFNEGFGNPLVESLGLGIPVIANKDEKIFCKWIKESSNGHLIKLNSKSWAKKIKNFNFNYSKIKISRDIHKKLNYEKYLNNYFKIFENFSKINKKTKININKIINN
mgnify:CR=1 FL=1